MRLKCIACEVVLRELCLVAATSPHTLDLVFTKKDAHDYRDTLRAAVQQEIDAAEADTVEYDAVLLAYGLCGGGLVDIQARSTPLILPRAHDCCTLFLGSKERFAEHFRNSPSQPFSAVGYMERGDTLFHVGGSDPDELSLRQLIDKYGEDNARYIWDTMHPHAQDQPVVFVDVPETTPREALKTAQEQAEAAGREFVVLPGSTELLKQLVHGQWDPNAFLRVEPGQRTSGVYDWVDIVQAVDGTT